MTELKIKFNVFENKLAMQVIYQAIELKGTVKDPIEFQASNGFVVSSRVRPGIYAQSKVINLQGEDNLNDQSLVYANFNSTKEAEEFLAGAKKAIKEYTTFARQYRLSAILGKPGEVIQVGECWVMFIPIVNGFVFQLVSSDVTTPNDRMKEGSDLKVEFLPNNESIVTLPLKTDDPVQTIINAKESEIKQKQLAILDTLSKLVEETEVEPSSYSELIMES